MKNLLKVHKLIEGRGYREQEKGFLFSGLYPSYEKRVTKNYKGKAKHFERNLKKGKYKP